MADILADIAEATKIETPVVETPVVETPVVETPVTETPAAEIPKVETPVAETPATPTPTPEPTVDLVKIFTEASNGKIKSVEELSQIIKEHNEYKERIAQSPELDDYTLKLNSWIKKGNDPQLFHKINGLPLDEMSSEDKMKVGLALQNPNWSEEDVNLYLKTKYNLLEAEDEGYDESKVRVGKLMLDQDARVHDQNLRKLQEQTVYSNTDEKEAYRLESERQGQWKSNLPNLVNAINTIPFPLDDKGNVFNYVPTPLQRQAVVSALEKAILNAPIGYDENGIKLISKEIQNQFINQNFNEIVRAVANHQKSAIVEKKIVETHNPSGKAQASPVVTEEKSLEEVSMDGIDKLLGGDRKTRR